MMNRKADGFTLIELLGVISIVAVLAALLMAAIPRVRENGRRATCQSNLKQVGVAVMQYLQDNDEYYPADLAFTGVTAPDAGPNWGNPLYPQPYKWYWQQTLFHYTKSDELFRCPDAPVGITRLDEGNYGANGNVLRGPANRMLTSRITSAASTYMICDCGNYVINQIFELAPQVDFYMPGTGDLGIALPEYIPESLKHQSWPLLGDFQSGRHFGGINMCFADGHVKWLNNATVLAQARLTEANPNTGAWSISAPPA